MLLSRRLTEWLLILLCAAAGMLIDSIWHWTGVLQFRPETKLIPLWLTGLWLVFSTTLNHALLFFQQRLWLAAFLGAIAGPVTYLTGVELGAAQTGLATLVLALLLGLCWMLLLPALLYTMREGRQRWLTK